MLALALLLTLDGSPARAADLGTHPALRAVYDTLIRDYDFKAESLKPIFDTIEINMRVVALMNRPGEARPWHKYRELFVTVPSAKRGVSFWQSNHAALDRTAATYGVDPAYIVAIIGVETRYGRATGRLRVLDALSTRIVHNPSRREFFSRELIHFMLFTREQGLDPLEIKGSYAGAIGAPQFMPSSYRSYAVDFDGDGKADLIHSITDAIGSVANYFHAHQWRPGIPVCVEALTAGSQAPWLTEIETRPTMSLRQFAAFGITPADKTLDPDLKAVLLRLTGSSGDEYRLVFDNFFVVMKYNRSYKYAMAVCDLARMTKNRMNAQ